MEPRTNPCVLTVNMLYLDQGITVVTVTAFLLMIIINTNYAVLCIAL